MGCFSTSKSCANLLLEFERGNNEQRAYGQKMIENFKSEKKISFKQSDITNSFKIILETNNEKHTIEDSYDNATGRMQESLDKIYKLLK